jgi:hypothetical protein
MYIQNTFMNQLFELKIKLRINTFFWHILSTNFIVLYEYIIFFLMADVQL